MEYTEYIIIGGRVMKEAWFSIGMTATKMISTVFFAYAVAKFEFPGRKFLYAFIVLQMMMPIYGQTAANYQLLDNLRLVDSPLFLIGQGAGHGMYFLIVYAFFRNLPAGYRRRTAPPATGFAH